MGVGTHTSGSLSKSAKVRAQLKHPVIDSDGHTVEFQPALREYIAKVGGPKLAERYRNDSANWYKMTPEQRRTQRPLRPPWWALPTKNTLDRATGTFPKLQYERLDETGIDFAVPFGRWLGHGGVTRFNEDQLDLVSTAAALSQVTSRIMLFSTAHVTYGFHPIHFAKIGCRSVELPQFGGRYGSFS